MRVANFYYGDVLLGVLYENGRFDYTVHSFYAEKMPIEIVMHQLEIIRVCGLLDSFNFDEYITEWNEYPFPSEFRFEINDVDNHND